MSLTLTGPLYWSCMERMAARIADCGDYVTALDAATGDGDHWVNLNMGFTELLEKKEELRDLELPDLFQAIAKILMTSIGGSSGVLYATAYLAAAKRTAGLTEIDLPELGEVLRIMAEAIMRRGKSEPGNKTMVDAIEPAARAMREAAAGGRGETEILGAMKQAAMAGAERTKDMPALRGRAYYQADKGVGHLDPGAVTMSYQLAALADRLMEEIGDSAGETPESAFDAASPNAWNDKGMTYFDDAFDKARICFSRALALDPFHARYYHNRGRKGLSLDRFQEALADFQTVMRLDPEDDDSRHYCGVAYFFMGMYREAIEEFRDSLRLMIKNGVALIPPTVDWAWMAYMRLGEPERAKELLDEYVTPDMPCEQCDYNYKKRVLLYAGCTTPEEFEREIDRDDDVLGLTATYGLALYYRYLVEDHARCVEYLRQVLAYRTSHHAFAYKLAAMDLAELA